MRTPTYPCDIDIMGECPFHYQHCADCKPCDYDKYSFAGCYDNGSVGNDFELSLKASLQRREED